MTVQSTGMENVAINSNYDLLYKRDINTNLWEFGVKIQLYNLGIQTPRQTRPTMLN